MGWNVSNILVNEAIANKKGGTDPELAGKVAALEADVTALESVAYKLTDVAEKELTGTNYEDMAELTLAAGVYHIIATAMNTVTTVAITGIRFADGTTALSQSVSDGLVKSVDIIYATDSQKTIKVQTKGSVNCKNVKTWILVAKVGDVTPPAQNTRKGGKK